MTMGRLVIGAIGLALTGVAAVLYIGFGAFLPWREHAEINRLAALADVRPQQVIAEIGAGSGRFSRALAERVGATGRVFASELDGPSFDALHERLAGVPNITVVRAGREDTRLPDACCDLLLMRNVYHHVQDPAVFPRQIHRAVRPGGRVVVIDFAPGSLWLHGGRPPDASDRRPGHGVSPDAVVAEFQAAGFSLVASEPQWSRPLWLLMFRRD